VAADVEDGAEEVVVVEEDALEVEAAVVTLEAGVLAEDGNASQFNNN
jgi:hypothetical protein